MVLQFQMVALSQIEYKGIRDFSKRQYRDSSVVL